MFSCFQKFLYPTRLFASLFVERKQFFGGMFPLSVSNLRKDEKCYLGSFIFHLSWRLRVDFTEAPKRFGCLFWINLFRRNFYPRRRVYFLRKLLFAKKKLTPPGAWVGGIETAPRDTYERFMLPNGHSIVVCILADSGRKCGFKNFSLGCRTNMF